MENVSFNNAQAVIQYWPVFAGRSEDGFSKYMRKVRVRLSLYNKPVFEVFQGADQLSPTVQKDEIERVDVSPERTWKQANQDL